MTPGQRVAGGPDRLDPAERRGQRRAAGPPPPKSPPGQGPGADPPPAADAGAVFRGRADHAPDRPAAGSPPLHRLPHPPPGQGPALPGPALRFVRFGRNRLEVLQKLVSLPQGFLLRFPLEADIIIANNAIDHRQIWPADRRPGGRYEGHGL